MTDWNADTAQLRENLRHVLTTVRDDAVQRKTPTVEAAREWQSGFFYRLTPPKPAYVGRFRGEPGIEHCEVEIGGNRGVPARDVGPALRAFEDKLQTTVAVLDGLIAPGEDLTADNIAAVIDLCAWVHSEWIRIHPFANGNGRTARIWANSIAMRYGLPPFVRLRPRPDSGYAAAADSAMAGHWQPMAQVFRYMYREAIRR